MLYVGRGCVNWPVWKVDRTGENIQKACACVWFVVVQPVGNTMTVIYIFCCLLHEGCVCVTRQLYLLVIVVFFFFFVLFCAFFCLLSCKDCSISNFLLHLHQIYMHNLLLINLFQLTVQHSFNTCGNNNEKMHPGFAVTVRGHTSSSTDGADTVSRQMVELSRDASASLFYFYITVTLLKDGAHENPFFWHPAPLLCSAVSISVNSDLFHHSCAQQVLTTYSVLMKELLSRFQKYRNTSPKSGEYK